MANKVSFSNQELSFKDIQNYHSTLTKALLEFYKSATDVCFVGYTSTEMRQELEGRLSELDKSSCLSLFASIEALLRINYLQRCEQKRKDTISRKMREIYLSKANKASLEDDILEIWKQEPCLTSIASQIKAAFKYRHWLAHGRYWTPKFGRKYDFDYLYTLGSEIVDQCEL